MSDLIERQAAIKGRISIQRANGVEIYSNEAVPVEYLKRLPPAQPERKRGEWIEAGHDDPCYYKCNQCGRLSDDKHNFCPNCGAKMEGE